MGLTELLPAALLSELTHTLASGPFWLVAGSALGAGACWVHRARSRARREAVRRARLEAIFAQHESRVVVDWILKSGEMPALGGERRPITVLFADIRGFTALSETL